MPAEFERMRKAIKQQLKKDNPNMKEDELEKRSWSIATTQWKKTHDGKAPSKESIENTNSEDKFDEEGRYIVAENVKMNITASIDTITE